MYLNGNSGWNVFCSTAIYGTISNCIQSVYFCFHFWLSIFFAVGCRCLVCPSISFIFLHPVLWCSFVLLVELVVLRGAYRDRWRSPRFEACCNACYKMLQAMHPALNVIVRGRWRRISWVSYCLPSQRDAGHRRSSALRSNAQMGLDCLQYPILLSIGRLNVDLALPRVVGESQSEGKDRQDPPNVERCAGTIWLRKPKNAPHISAL